MQIRLVIFGFTSNLILKHEMTGREDIKDRGVKSTLLTNNNSENEKVDTHIISYGKKNIMKRRPFYQGS